MRPHLTPSAIQPKRNAISLFMAKLVFLAVLLTVFSGLASAEQNAQAAPLAETAGPRLSQDQIRDLIRRAAERDIANDRQAANYTYIERAEQHKLDGSGRVNSTESKTYEVMALYGEQVRRLIAKDDTPLSAKDAAKEEEKIQKLIEERKN